MKENGDNKNISAIERRILKFFFSLTDREKKLSELACALGISLSTAQRYSRVLEEAGIARIKNKKYRGGKSAALCKNVYFFVVRIGKNTVDITLVSFLPKYQYSVILPYNEALTDIDNALCAKRLLDKLYAQVRADKALAAFILSDGACINEDILHKASCGSARSCFKGKILKNDKKKAQDMSVEESISALVVEMIRNIRKRTVDQVSGSTDFFSFE